MAEKATPFRAVPSHLGRCREYRPPPPPRLRRKTFNRNSTESKVYFSETRAQIKLDYFCKEIRWES